jgi:hypothetical protein
MYNKKWIKEYKYLERLRESGKCNMFGSVSYLLDFYGLTYRDANAIVISWVKNRRQLIEDGIIGGV